MIFDHKPDLMVNKFYSKLKISLSFLQSVLLRMKTDKFELTLIKYQSMVSNLMTFGHMDEWRADN